MTSRHTAAAIALSVLGIISPSADESGILVQVDTAYVAQHESGQAWTVGNAGIAFDVGLDATGALVPLGLRTPGSETPLIVAQSADLTFLNQARRLSPGQPGFPFREAYADEYLGGVRLRLVFDALTSRLRVTRSYVCYPGAPAIETWSTFEAIDSAASVPVSDLGVWQFTMPVRDVNWVTGLKATAVDGGRFTIRRHELTPGARLELGSTTRSSESAVPTVWFRGSEGMFFGGLLWSGTWTMTASGPAADGLVTIRMSAGPTATTVRRDEPLDTPHGVFGIAGSQDADVAAALQRYVVAGLRHGRPIEPLVTYNSWFAYGNRIDEASMRSEMAREAALGVELFVLDAGWYPGGTSVADYTTGLGTWTADPRRFPSGLAALGDHARSLGMKFGIWVEPERVATTTINRAGLARERFLATTGGRYNPGVKNEHAGAALICLGDTEARQWVVAQLMRFIDTVRPDYLKWDNNEWINCDRTNHGHGTHDGNFAHVKGLYEVLAALRARYPDLLIENCASGGHRLDLGMLQYTDSAWMDDVSAPSAHVRHNIQGLSAVFPSPYLLSFVMDDAAEFIHQAADMPLYFRSRMLGALGLSLAAEGFGEEDVESMTHEIALFKQLRASDPKTVSHLLTPQTAAAGQAGWDAVQWVARDSGSAVVFAFSGAGASRWTRIPLKDLEPDKPYAIRFPRGRQLATVKGRDLMENGVLVFDTPYSKAHVLLVSPLEPSPPAVVR